MTLFSCLGHNGTVMIKATWYIKEIFDDLGINFFQKLQFLDDLDQNALSNSFLYQNTCGFKHHTSCGLFSFGTKTPFRFIFFYLEIYSHAIKFFSEIDIKIISWKFKSRDALCNSQTR